MIKTLQLLAARLLFIITEHVKRQGIVERRLMDLEQLTADLQVALEGANKEVAALSKRVDDGKKATDEQIAELSNQLVAAGDNKQALDLVKQSIVGLNEIHDKLRKIAPADDTA